jgi:hypothetical protein
MGKWKGIMISGFLEIPVNIVYERPSNGVDKWYGSGETDKYWPMNQPQLETNIGTILIVKSEMRMNGKHYIEFKGSEHPQGPLAEAMGQNS